MSEVSALRGESKILTPDSGPPTPNICGDVGQLAQRSVSATMRRASGVSHFGLIKAEIAFAGRLAGLFSICGWADGWRAADSLAVLMAGSLCKLRQTVTPPN